MSFVEMETNRGHDTFLFNEPGMFCSINIFPRSAAREKGPLV
jgi:homoserine O-acetyltransferase